MPRISPPTTTASSGAGFNTGFTLLEILIVITIMGLTVALVLPNIQRSISNAVARTYFFEFQNQATGLRAKAYHENQAMMLVSSGQFVDDPDAEVRSAEIQLCSPNVACGWTYKVSTPMLISAGGVCDAADVDLYYNAIRSAHLESQPDCHFKQVAN